MGKASTEEALSGLARSRRHSGAIIQTAKQIVLIHLGIFILPRCGQSCYPVSWKFSEYGFQHLDSHSRAL